MEISILCYNFSSTSSCFAPLHFSASENRSTKGMSVTGDTVALKSSFVIRETAARMTSTRQQGSQLCWHDTEEAQHNTGLLLTALFLGDADSLLYTVKPGEYSIAPLLYNSDR